MVYTALRRQINGSVAIVPVKDVVRFIELHVGELSSSPPSFCRSKILEGKHALRM